MNEKRFMVLTKCLTSGGAERVAANLATELSKNAKTYLLVFDGSVKTYKTEAEVIDLQLPQAHKVWKKIAWYMKVIFAVRREIKRLKITDTISFLNEADLINVLVGKHKIVSVRNNRSALNRPVIVNYKDKIVFWKADRIVALSYGVKADLVLNYSIDPNKIDVIYNACDVKKIQTFIDDGKAEVQEKFKGKKPLIITAGRLTNQKGQWHLIRAFNAVKKVVPNVHLAILGQGENKEYLLELIKAMELEESIELLGYHENPYKYLAQADIFAFSSLYEGFGNILLEAMACHLPIVSTDCPVGPRELLEPGYIPSIVQDGMLRAEYGILVPVCDGYKYSGIEELTNQEKILADALILLCKDERIREYYSKQSDKRIRDFLPEQITEKWLEVIRG